MIGLSLFDGMSCGQLALESLGIKVDTYYASEVDKYAMQVTNHNYPKTIQLGDVRNITIERLSENFILINKRYKIDIRKLLLKGGSPCQGFSVAGKMKGMSTTCNIDITSLEQYLELKEDGFKFDGQSYLFWEYIRLLREIKPKYFFLENVRVQKKWKKVFDEHVGCKAILINSSLVSAQNRKRYYWTNIPNVTQPKDKGILLKDILEGGVDTVGAIRGRYKLDGKRQDHKMKVAGLTTQELEIRKDNKSNCLTTVQKDNVAIQTLYNVNPSGKGMNGNVYGTEGKSPCLTTNKGEGVKIDARPCELREYDEASLLHHAANAVDVKGHDYNKRVYAKTGKAPTLAAATGGNLEPKVLLSDKNTYRKLTPLECERLQTVPDGYTLVLDANGKQLVSNSQRYKMLGNGWTIAVIAHIFKGLIDYDGL